LLLAEITVLPFPVRVRGANTAKVDVVLVFYLVVGFPLPVRKKSSLPLRNRLLLIVISDYTSPLVEPSV
jgi:hypothetical protein